MPVVSIIIPCYNYSHYLALTLENLKNQIFQDWECLIVDDGSTDDTKSVVENHIFQDARFRYLYQNRKGVSAARNIGLKQSQGLYVQFLDADDLLESDKIQKQVQAFYSNAYLDIVYSSARYFRNLNPEERLYFLGEQDTPWIPEFFGNGQELLPVLLKTNIMPIHSPLIKKEALQKVGYFNESMKYLEDWEYWFRCAYNNLNFSFCNLPNTLALVRVHETSVSNKKWEFRLAELALKEDYFKKYLRQPYLKDLSQDIYHLKRRLLSLAMVDLVKGNIDLFKVKIRAITKKPTTFTGLKVIMAEKLWPVLSWKMLLKGWKTLLK